jgi:hypothetical protein
MQQYIGLNYAMDAKEFAKYVPILSSGEFELSPNPEGPNGFHSGDRFEYLSDDGVHLVIRHTGTRKHYYLPLAVVEFANPGNPAVLRLTRPMKIWRDSSFI